MSKQNLFVIKVQAPINGADVLIYNEDKSVEMLAPFDRKFKKMMKDKLKAFFWAKIEQGNLQIGDKAPWQEW